MVTRLRAAIFAALIALCLIVGVKAEDGTLMNLVGRVDVTTHALAVAAVSPGGTDVNGAIGGLIGSTDSTTRALKVYFDATAAALLPTSIQLGGTTSSFPMLKRSTTTVQVRLADDSGGASLNAAGIIAAQTGVVVMSLSGNPTISSGFGTSPSIASSNGATTFRVNVGTGGVATSGVVGMPTASNGWNCQVTDMTNNTVTRETASATTTVTVTAAAAWAASDILIFTCFAY